MKRKHLELWVGIFLIVGTLLVFALAMKLGKFDGKMKDAYTVKVVFQDAAGIIKGNIVRMGGVQIGEVSDAPSLSPMGDAVEVPLKLQRDVRIPKESVVQAAIANLLGEKYIEITPPRDQDVVSYIQPGDVIRGDTGDDIEKIKVNVAKITEQTITLLKRVELTMVDVQAASKGFADVTKRVNGGVLSDENVDRFNVIMENLSKTSGQLELASRDLPKMMNNFEETSVSIRNTSVKVEDVVNRVEEKMQILDPAIKTFPSLMVSLKKTVDDVDKTVVGIKQSKGIFNTLLYDEKLKDDVVDFVRHARAQGILRYKNPEAEEEMTTLQERASMQGRRR